MGLIQAIKNLFRKGGEAMGVVQSLGQITDHPKISIDSREYRRIDLDKQYFEGQFPNVKYVNMYGDQRQRQYVTLNMMQVICRRMASIIYNRKAR